jgi:hypothetical protein
MRSVVMLVAVVASGLALAGCGDDSETTTTTDTQAAAPTTPATTTTATAPPPTTTTTESTSTTTAAPKPKTIVVTVANGRPQGGIQRPKLEKGDKVVLVVRTDAGEEVHLHGYDIERQVTPGKPVRIAFTAKLPGRFELELHHPDALLAVLEVQS